MGDETPKRKFHDATFIGGGVMLDPETRTYIPFKWEGDQMVTGEPEPYPGTLEEMNRLQAMADGYYKPPVSGSQKERIVGFSIFEDVISNDGRGFRRNGVLISDEEAERLWEQSPDNPVNKHKHKHKLPE